MRSYERFSTGLKLDSSSPLGGGGRHSEVETNPVEERGIQGLSSVLYKGVLAFGRRERR